MESPAAHRDSEGFSELAPVRYCSGAIQDCPSGRELGCPRPLQITPEQRGQALPCLCSSIPGCRLLQYLPVTPLAAAWGLLWAPVCCFFI